MDYQVLGEGLRKAREGRGYTQKQIADLLEVTPQTVSMWEKGKNKIDIETLDRLCRIYGLDIRRVLEEALDLSREAGAATEGERLHLERYRRLTEEGRQAVEGMMEALLQAEGTDKVLPLPARPGGKLQRGYAAFDGEGWTTEEIEASPAEVDEAFAKAEARQKEREAQREADRQNYFRQLDEQKAGKKADKKAKKRKK